MDEESETPTATATAAMITERTSGSLMTASDGSARAKAPIVAIVRLSACRFLVSMFVHNDRYAGNVVGLRCGIHELRHPHCDVLHHLARWLAARLDNRLFETRRAELRGGDGFGFGHAVGVEHQHVASRQRDRLRHVAHV